MREILDRVADNDLEMKIGAIDERRPRRVSRRWPIASRPAWCWHSAVVGFHTH